MNLYWTGGRGSDTRYTGNLFKGSITIYGDNKDGNISYCSGRQRINHNVFCPEASEFILEKQLELIEKQPDCLFMAYNPNFVYGASKNVMERTLCLNDERLMKHLENKIEFRKIAKDIINMVDCEVVFGSELSSNECVKGVKKGDRRIVVQFPTLFSGGVGTFLIDGSNLEILDNLDENMEYIVSPYIEGNIPINIHCIIYNEINLILPPSVQLIVNENNRLIYRGADYISYRDIPNEVKQEVINQLERICDKLRKDGYRGVIGFDGLICHDGIYFTEANNRFQGSTYPLNCALWRNGLPSVQELNLEAFGVIKSTDKSTDAASINVPCSYYIFTNDFGGTHARHIMENAHRSNSILGHSGDDFDIDQSAEENAYLFHTLLGTNICSVDLESCKAAVHPAFESPSAQWYNLIAKEKDISAIKISLINQGIIISDAAKRYLTWDHGLCDGNYFIIDLLIDRSYYVSCPITMKFATLSPFILEYEKVAGLSVTYYGNTLLEDVVFIPKPTLKTWATSSGNPLCDMAFFSTDRLRLQNSPTCVFNKTKQPCGFCEVCDWDLEFNEKDILETIDACFALQPTPFRHILIGGRSNAIGKEKQTILNMCAKIREYSNIPVYLMCLPPNNLSDIKDYFDAGITEFGFNIEVFDRKIAKKIMPGKGKIPVKQYLDALEYAADLCGKTGAVRSAFVVGLESWETLLKGVEAVCKVGAAPILSAFRPVLNTPLENTVPLSSAELFRITTEAEGIAECYGQSLGPSCISCQNNTLTIIKNG